MHGEGNGTLLQYSCLENPMDGGAGFSVTGWGIDLDYCDIEWFALETEIILSFLSTSKYCISDCFVDYDSYSISSKGFLSTSC